MKFTPKTLDALKPQAARYDVTETGVSSDRRGLQVRVFPSGTKTFRARYTFADKPHVLTLGNWPAMTLKEAHDKLAEIRGMIGEGHNPKGDAPVQTEGFTVRQLAEEWRDKYLKSMVERRGPDGAKVQRIRVATWEENWRRVEKDVLPVLGERPAADVRQREIVLLLDAVMERGSPVAANKLRGDIAKMYRVGVSRGLVESSPVVAIDKPHEETSRDRRLTDPEVKKFWKRLDDAAMLPMMRLALKFLLVTGQRSGELRRATWAEFDFSNKLWTIPAEHVEKSRRSQAHEVPLSPLAVDVLQALRASLGDYDGELLLPSPHRLKAQPIEARALAHAVRNNREAFGIPAFTPHDLRRTVRSGLAALGIADTVAKRVLNHKIEGMDAVYNQHGYQAEKRQALQLWAEHVAAVAAGKRAKVQPIRAQAG